MKVLFVCTGNSCRSVMAQGLLQHMLQQRGRNDVQVLSAGVSTLGGLGPTQETVEVMKSAGIDVSGHIGQPVTPEIVACADAVFCMEKFQREVILSRIPGAKPKVHLLKLFRSKVKTVAPNIPDPIGCPQEMYESCMMTIRDSVERIMTWIEKGEKEISS